MQKHVFNNENIKKTAQRDKHQVQKQQVFEDQLSLLRARQDPLSSTSSKMLALQKNYGNQAVTGLIQASLETPSTSYYEQEAERAVKQVLNAKPNTSGNISLTPVTHSNGEFETDPEMMKHLHSNKGKGSPLPSSLRKSVEPQFGADFSKVRLHTGLEAGKLNQKIKAKAFTYGSDIYLGNKASTPGSPSVNRLITHELAHVVQQNGGSSSSHISTPQLARDENPTVQRFGEGLAKFFGIGKKKGKTQSTTEAKKPETEPSTTSANPVENKSPEAPKEAEKPSETKPNPYSITNLGVRPDYAEDNLIDQTPNEFVVTIAVAREREDNLKFAKTRLESSVRNQMRKFARKIPLLKKFVRKPKTADEIKTKAARKTFEDKSATEKAKDIQSARQAHLLPPNFDTLPPVSQESEGKRAAIQFIESQSGSVGHTWVKLSTKVGGKLQEISSFGFWPKKWISEGQMRGGFGHPNIPVPGMVMHPDTIHEDGADQLRYKDVPVKGKNFQAALKLAVNRFQSPPPYVLTDYNCTKFAKEITTAAGASFPGEPIVPGWYANLLNTLTRSGKGSKTRMEATLSPGGTYEGMEGQEGVYSENRSPEDIAQPDLYLPNATTTQYEQHLAENQPKPSEPEPEPEPTGVSWTIDLTRFDKTVRMLDQIGNTSLHDFKNEKVTLKVLSEGFPEDFGPDSYCYVDVKYGDEYGMMYADELIKYKERV